MFVVFVTDDNVPAEPGLAVDRIFATREEAYAARNGYLSALNAIDSSTEQLISTHVVSVMPDDGFLRSFWIKSVAYAADDYNNRYANVDYTVRLNERVLAVVHNLACAEAFIAAYEARSERQGSEVPLLTYERTRVPSGVTLPSDDNDGYESF